MTGWPNLFDRLAALLGLIVLSPLFLYAAIRIKADSPGPAFFRQERIGRGGRPFRIWKFRTMSADAPQRGGALTTAGDARITRFGQRLRASKIDELPQLINVLLGEMALVGPRPEVPKYVAAYSPDQRAVLEVRPGITDPASLQFRDESGLLAQQEDPEAYYVSTLMAEKIRLNLEYQARRSFWSDIGVILNTVRTLWS